MQRIPQLQQSCVQHLSRAFSHGDSCLHRRLSFSHSKRLHRRGGRHLREVACAAQTVPKTSPEVANMPWTNSPQQQQVLLLLLPPSHTDNTPPIWLILKQSSNLSAGFSSAESPNADLAWRAAWRGNASMVLAGPQPQCGGSGGQAAEDDCLAARLQAQFMLLLLMLRQ